MIETCALIGRLAFAIISGHQAGLSPVEMVTAVPADQQNLASLMAIDAADSWPMMTPEGKDRQARTFRAKYEAMCIDAAVKKN